MRKIVIVLYTLVCFLAPVLLHAMEVAIEITGPQELTTLKAGMEKTIITRCVAKGIPLERYNKLSVTVSKLGDIISYDALLDTTPQRAFHKDLKDTSNLSGTIDEMIGAIFTETSKSQPASVTPTKTAVGQENVVKIKLPFVATSIASIGEKMFVSDNKKVYELKDEKASPLWPAPGKNEILRIYPYGESLIVLTKIMNEFKTFMIQGSETKERWNKAVIPLGTGLVSTNLMFDKVYGTTPYVWSQATQVTGSSPQILKGLDIISATLTGAETSSASPSVISFNFDNRMVVSDGKSILWTDDTDSGITPQFIEDELVLRGSPENEPPARYYLKPRIASLGPKIITFRNGQGSARMLPRLNLFEYTQILVYTPSGKEFNRYELAFFPDSYCSDITIAQGKVAALIVKNKNTYVQFLGL